MACTHCGKSKVVARGFCGGCYQRNRTNGTLARKNSRNVGHCSRSGCHEPAVTKGLCRYHYDRQKHPLKNTWKLIRSRYAREIPVAWDDFETFVREVGERPTAKHQLRRMDETQPYSSTNVRWVEPLRVDNYTREQRSEYAHAWSLKKMFGLSKADYDKMVEEQDGVCAICRSETERRLHVDHCHKTGKIRGLLCVSCNRMLGYANDDPEVIDKAIAYLCRG